MSPLITDFRYRPEIDGLRAVAVVAVVLYHAGLGFPGGFVGVDVFFVISGFLITSIIIKDLQAGTFSLAQFWERRARRILPAGVAMVFATLAAGWFLLLPSDYARLGASAVSQAAFAGNIYFWRKTDYFAAPAEEVPLLHTWSLAVEEQYYFVIPFLMFGIFQFPALRSRTALVTVFAAALLASLALSVYAVPHSPAAAFYLLPTRAWELLCGSLIAVLPDPRPRRNRRLLAGCSCFALSAIVLPYLLYDADTSFPGIAALPPFLGAALFIWASKPVGSDATLQMPAKLLAARPFVFIGLISYSLYLWHWPLFAFATYWSSGGITIAYRVLLVAVSGLFAILSWRYIETPFRERVVATSRRQMFQIAVVALCLTSIPASYIIMCGGVPERFSKSALSAAAIADEPRYHLTSKADAIAGNLKRIGSGDDDAPLHLLVWGDSHARMLIPALEAECVAAGVVAEVATYPSTAPVLDFPQKGKHGLHGSESVAWNAAILNRVKQSEVPNVILIARWSSHLREGNVAGAGKYEGQHFAAAFIDTVAQLNEIGTRVWICREVPAPGYAVPRRLAFSLQYPNLHSMRHIAYQDYKFQTLGMGELIKTMPKGSVRVNDASPYLFDPCSASYKVADERCAYYCDSHHFSAAGAMLVRAAFTPLFDR